jgi:fusion and transport protein UGO1
MRFSFGLENEQFGMAAGAHLTVFALGLVSAGLGGRSLEYGWKEI